MNDLTRQVRIDVHDVMRVDEIHRHEPWLPLRSKRLAVAAEPACDAVGGQAIVRIAAEAAVDQVADAEEIVEAIGRDDLAILSHGRVDRDLGLIEVGAQMPLALIGSVVAEFAHAMADRLDRRRHVRLPEIIEIVEDTRVLDVLAGVDDRAGRRANAGRGLMIGECHALRFQEFSCGNRKWPFWKKVFLVNEDEQDVVAGGRRIRRSNSGPGGDGEGVHAKQRRGALLEQLAA